MKAWLETRRAPCTLARHSTTGGNMSNLSKLLVVVLTLGFASIASSDDYRSASATAYRVASARSSLGDTPGACAALSRSLEHYRSSLANEAGFQEAAASNLY